MHKARQAHRPACDVEHRLRLRPSAHHVHVHYRLDPLCKLRLGIQQRNCPFNLRRPNKSNRPRRSRQRPLVDQLLQRPRHLQNRHAPAGIVVRSRPLMVQVARKRNLLLLQLRIRPRNRRRHHFIISRMLSRLHHRMQPDLFSALQPFLHRPRRLQRHHERKRLVLRKCLQMSPADQILILAPPRRFLVLRVTHNPHPPKFPHCQILHRSRLRACQHNLSLHILPRVVALFRPLPHIR